MTENYAPGVIERMGLGYERLRAIKPDLIMLSLSGYGQSGPASRYVSYGAMIAAQAGLYAATGYPGDVPREVGVSYADPVAGITGALMIQAALIHRARTGEGQYLDVTLLEALEMFMPEALLQIRDQWARAAVYGQSRPVDGAAQLLQIARRRRGLGYDCGRHASGMARAVRRDGTAVDGRRPAFSHRRAAQAKRG